MEYYKATNLQYIYNMECYKSKKHDLDLCLLTQEDPHYRQKINPDSKCVYIVKDQEKLWKQIPQTTDIDYCKGVNLKVEGDY